jgi:hypothetical protein
MTQFLYSLPFTIHDGEVRLLVYRAQTATRTESATFWSPLRLTARDAADGGGDDDFDFDDAAAASSQQDDASIVANALAQRTNGVFAPVAKNKKTGAPLVKPRHQRVAHAVKSMEVKLRGQHVTVVAAAAGAQKMFVVPVRDVTVDELRVACADKRVEFAWLRASALFDAVTTTTASTDVHVDVVATTTTTTTTTTAAATTATTAAVATLPLSLPFVELLRSSSVAATMRRRLAAFQPSLAVDGDAGDDADADADAGDVAPSLMTADNSSSSSISESGGDASEKDKDANNSGGDAGTAVAANGGGDDAAAKQAAIDAKLALISEIFCCGKCRQVLFSNLNLWSDSHVASQGRSKFSFGRRDNDDGIDPPVNIALLLTTSHACVSLFNIVFCGVACAQRSRLSRASFFLSFFLPFASLVHVVLPEPACAQAAEHRGIRLDRRRHRVSEVQLPPWPVQLRRRAVQLRRVGDAVAARQQEESRAA